MDQDLLNQLESDLQDAMRERDKIRLTVLRLLKSALKNYQIEVGHDLSNQEVLSILQKEAKKRQEAAQAYEQAGRVEQAQEERDELATIESYLPEQMSEADVTRVVTDVIAATPADQRQMGPIIGQVRAKTEGQADGALIAKLVAQELKKQG
jgi:uncharacterized protein YqeY